ncbi:competence/damage-inducible protein A [Limibacillus halophilus]
MSEAKAGAPGEVTAGVLIIGNEILSGRTKDINLPYLGDRLHALGVVLAEARVIPDVEEVIVKAVQEFSRRFTYVFTTGGIGPTHDDITADCVAKAFGVPLIENPEARAILEAHYEPGMLNAARLRMARTPEGAALISNPVSAAPGFRMGNVHVMAGVPKIMQAMFDGIADSLVGGAPVLSRTVISNLPEGAIAEGLGQVQARYPALQIGSYPSFRAGNFGTSLVLRGSDAAELDRAAQEVFEMVKALGGDPKLEITDPSAPAS